MDLKSKHSYQTQSFLWLLGFSWLLIVCFVGFQYHREKELRTELLDSQLQIINAQLEEALSNARTPHDFFDAHSDFFEGLRITLIDLDGTVVYDSEEPPAEMSNHLDRPEVAAALTDGHGYTIRRQSENNGRTYFYSASRIGDRIVRSSLPYTVSLSQVLNADRNFLWFMGSVTLLLCLVGYYVVRQFTKNMVQMEATLAERDREHAAALHEEQEKIRIKRQLTNNINHELKTPVSSIHGYLETLIANPHIDAATQRAFLEKCFTQSERLRQLLQDVSSITRLDEGGQMIDRTEVDLRALIGEVITDTAPESARRGFTVHWTCDRPLTVEGNEGLLYSVFRNLTDNALNYSGGNRIDIALTDETDDRYEFSFSDNGTGVNPEHLPYLFERFYRIDKGRSRRAGGTGLGLAIVRNAILFHGGRIEVANRPEGGLVFRFSIAKKGRRRDSRSPSKSLAGSFNPQRPGSRTDSSPETVPRRTSESPSGENGIA